MSDTQLLELTSVKKIRILYKRNGRMKLSFNLTSEEAQAFKNFFEAVNVNNNTEEEFVKAAFILGLRSMEASIIERMKEEAEKAETSEEPEIVEDDTEETEE